MKELLARLRAITRRTTEQPKTSILQVADLSLDTRTHQVRRGGKRIELAVKEYSVLECLMREPGRVLTRTMIAEHVWNYDTFNQSNVVDVYVRNLRRKIDDPVDKKLIRTLRWAGYSISGDDETN
jgi:DNA-binding response OmpR family regulator